jgi:hypothetical protein
LNRKETTPTKNAQVGQADLAHRFPLAAALTLPKPRRRARGHYGDFFLITSASRISFSRAVSNAR